MKAGRKSLVRPLATSPAVGEVDERSNNKARKPRASVISGRQDAGRGSKEKKKGKKALSPIPKKDQNEDAEGSPEPKAEVSITVPNDSRPWSAKVWPENSKFWTRASTYIIPTGLQLGDDAPFNLHIRAIDEPPSESAELYGDKFYEVYDQSHKRLYAAVEKSNRSGGSRPFVLTFLDNTGNVFMKLERAGSSKLCCFGATCFGNDAILYDGKENVLCTIRQDWKCGALHFSVTLPDLPGNRHIKVNGPDRRVCWLSYVGDDTTFDIVTTLEDDMENLSEANCIGIYRLEAAPQPFQFEPAAVLKVETKAEPSYEFQWIFIGVGSLLHLSYFEEKQSGFFGCYGGCWMTLLILLLAAIAIGCFVFVGAFFLPGGIADFQQFLFMDIDTNNASMKAMTSTVSSTMATTMNTIVTTPTPLPTTTTTPP